jgi:hypothetical protein
LRCPLDRQEPESSIKRRHVASGKTPKRWWSFGQWPVEAFEVSGEISSYGGRGFCPLCGSRLLDPVGPVTRSSRFGSESDDPDADEHVVFVGGVPPAERQIKAG